MATKRPHVHLQAGKKHYVIDTYLPKESKGVIAFQNVKSVFPDQHSSQDEPYDMRQPQSSEGDWNQQYYEEHHEENPGGVGN